MELTCNVSGLATGQGPSVRWARNGLDIAVDGGRFYFPQPNVMRINQALLADSGMYQCFVRVETGQLAGGGSQASAELVVRDFPTRLTDVFNEQMVYPGRPVYLHCSATGSPAPSIVWTVDSFPVPYTSGRISAWSHQLDENGIKSYLNISASEVEDGGLYCCSIQNLSGYNQLEQEAKSATHHCARLNVYGLFITFSFEYKWDSQNLFCICRHRVDPLGRQQDGRGQSGLLPSLPVRRLPNPVS